MEEAPVRDQLSRRALLIRSAAVAGATALLGSARAASALAQGLPRPEDLTDTAAGFQRGSGRGVSIEAGALRAATDGATFTSRVLASASGFTHLGLHWDAEVPAGAGLSLEVRMGPDPGSWSAWQPVQIERGPGETPQGDTFGALVFAGDARVAQYRATFQVAGAASPRLRRVTATAIAAPGPAGGTAAAPAPAGGTTLLPTTAVSDTASGRSLALTSREQWSADESLRFSGGVETWPEMFVPPKKLVVHHTATRNSYATAADAVADVQSIYRYHAITQGWGDIGYTALIDKFGNIYEGRHGRGGDPGDTLSPREVLSAGVVAGHDLHHNYGSAGVALLGDATKHDWPMKTASGPMWDALVRYSVFEAGRSFLRPDVASDFLRSDGVWTANMNDVSGHRETNSTTCPGTPVMNLLPTLRGAISSGLADTSRTGVTLASSPTANSASKPTTSVGTAIVVTWAAQQPEPGWTVTGYESCVEGWQFVSTYDIGYLSGYDSTKQPYPVWTPTAGTSLTFKPTQAGHYTVHVRVLVTNGSTTRRAAYEGNLTYFVQ
jgi:hypothetical protein